MLISHLKTLLKTPNLASKKWVYEQYDSQVMNDTITTKADAAIVRVHNSKKALAITTDCTPRYVEADPFEGSKQAVAETYRNISAVGGKPLAITNCLNFGNPQKPEIMGQIVRSIQGITESCKALDYPVVSGNVSLYNETDGKAIQPTPAIGGVGLLSDYEKRCDLSFKNIGDEILLIGKTLGHIDCSIFQKEILKIEMKKNPPKVDLQEEKKNGEFIRDLISKKLINACHDISDGGLLIALFEMCFEHFGFEINLLPNDLEAEKFLFAEDQSRYVISAQPSMVKKIKELAKNNQVEIISIGSVIQDKVRINHQNQIEEETIIELSKINQQLFEEKFGTC
jgi:phosphoribosylformylglycinamidine synthase